MRIRRDREESRKIRIEVQEKEIELGRKMGQKEEMKSKTRGKMTDRKTEGEKKKGKQVREDVAER